MLGVSRHKGKNINSCKRTINWISKENPKKMVDVDHWLVHHTTGPKISLIIRPNFARGHHTALHVDRPTLVGRSSVQMAWLLSYCLANDNSADDDGCYCCSSTIFQWKPHSLQLISIQYCTCSYEVVIVALVVLGSGGGEISFALDSVTVVEKMTTISHTVLGYDEYAAAAAAAAIGVDVAVVAESVWIIQTTSSSSSSS